MRKLTEAESDTGQQPTLRLNENCTPYPELALHRTLEAFCYCSFLVCHTCKEKLLASGDLVGNGISSQI